VAGVEGALIRAPILDFKVPRIMGIRVDVWRKQRKAAVD
jgi:hypothetical protein